MDALEKKQELLKVCHKVAKEKYVTSHGGNLSCKLNNEMITITPTKTNKEDVYLNNLVDVDIETGKVHVTYSKIKPTGELPFHLHLYRNRPDINCIIHAHPPILTGFAIARSTLLEYAFLPEVAFELGSIQTVKYAEPCSDSLAKSFDPVIQKGNAFLMENHGITIVGTEGIKRCCEMLEMLEMQAYSIMVAQAVGGPLSIPDGGLKGLDNVIRKRNLKLPCSPSMPVGIGLTDLFKRK